MPFYVVLGELDGGRIARNALVLDRYLKNGYNTTVVEYLGRGHEHFLDEQLPLFDWMNRCKRSFPLPRERELTHEREFDCKTMRPERQLLLVGGNPGPAAELHRHGLDVSHEAKPFVRARAFGTRQRRQRASSPLPAACGRCWCGQRPTNTLVLTAGNSRTTIWLSPEMVNFNARINITVGGRRPSGVPAMIKPSVETMLEDLRVRGDRQHPFWAKVETK